MNKYLLSGSIGVLESHTHEELISYMDFEFSYESKREFHFSVQSEYSLLCAIFKMRYQSYLVDSGKIEALKGKDWFVDTMSFGFKKL
jgi:hypothetical protein